MVPIAGMFQRKISSRSMTRVTMMAMHCGQGIDAAIDLGVAGRGRIAGIGGRRRSTYQQSRGSPARWRQTIAHDAARWRLGVGDDAGVPPRRQLSRPTAPRRAVKRTVGRRDAHDASVTVTVAPSSAMATAKAVPTAVALPSSASTSNGRVSSFATSNSASAGARFSAPRRRRRRSCREGHRAALPLPSLP